MFNYFETCSAAERETIAENLKKLYNRYYTRENETFLAMRAATQYRDAQKQYIAAVSTLGAIQAVFHELGIEFSGLYEI